MEMSRFRMLWCILFHHKERKVVATFLNPHCRISECEKCGSQFVDIGILTRLRADNKFKRAFSAKLP